MDAKNHVVDKSRIVIPEGTMEDFKRPNHTDFMTSTELKAARFSGMRRNEMARQSEVWIDGEMVIAISDEELKRNPQAMNIAMQDAFGMHRVMPDTDEVLAYDGMLRK